MSGRSVNAESERFFLKKVEEGVLLVSRTGTIFNTKTGRYIGAVGSGKYFKISMKDHEAGVIRCMQIHRLVFQVFKGPIPEGMEVDHSDSNKLNNDVDNNLTLMTPKENTRKAWRENRCNPFPKGNLHWKASHAAWRKNRGY